MTSGRAPIGYAPGPPVPRSGVMRVLLVVDSLSGGGAERHVVDLALALRRVGHEVAVACSAGGVLAPLLDAGGVPVHVLVGREVKRRSSLTYARALRRLLGHWPADVVHAHIYASAVAAAAATAGRQVPLLITEHTEAPWRSARARAVSGWTYRRATQVVAVSSAIERLLRADFGVPARKVTFVLPGVPDRAGPTPAGSYHLSACVGRTAPSARGPVVGRVGRLQPEKGVDVFLRAVALMADRYPCARFLVVGDGPLRGELVELAGRLGLGGRVEFCGYRADARDLIGQLDVLVVSSHSDGSPLVVLEAMAAGVPVVATAVGGIPDQLRHRHEGLLVPPGDPAALAGATAELLADPGRARTMGAAGQERAAALGHDRMVERLEHLYRRAAGAPAPAAVPKLDIGRSPSP